jgi:hypothetical protein
VEVSLYAGGRWQGLIWINGCHFLQRFGQSAAGKLDPRQSSPQAAQGWLEPHSQIHCWTSEYAGDPHTVKMGFLARRPEECHSSKKTNQKLGFILVLSVAVHRMLWRVPDDFLQQICQFLTSAAQQKFTETEASSKD